MREIQIIILILFCYIKYTESGSCKACGDTSGSDCGKSCSRVVVMQVTVTEAVKVAVARVVVVL